MSSFYLRLTTTELPTSVFLSFPTERTTSGRVVSRVPQGTVLGPILFLKLINDLPTKITSSIKLFADDCVPYRPINSAGDQFAL